MTSLLVGKDTKDRGHTRADEVAVKENNKFTRPLGLAADGKTMNVFSSLEEAQGYLKKHSAIIVIDKNGSETERSVPGNSASADK